MMDLRAFRVNGYARSQWTTTPPTEPGWYWCWNGEGQPSIENVFWDELDKAWGIYANNGEFSDPLPMGCHWLGPLPVPDPPPIDVGQKLT